MTITASGIRNVSTAYAPTNRDKAHLQDVCAQRADTGGTNVTNQDHCKIEVGPTDGTGYRLLNSDFGTSPSCWQLPKVEMDSTLDIRASIDALFACMATAKSRTFALDGLLRVY